VDELPNILVIGLTNRRDLLDEALLRPGRLEVHVEIGLPDEGGRLQILRVHTDRMASNEFLAGDVDLAKIARATKNFSGAEIEGLVKNAAGFALSRSVDPDDLHKPVSEDNIKVSMSDFDQALTEAAPAFGAALDLLGAYLVHGIEDYGERWDNLTRILGARVQQVQSGSETRLLSVMLEGPMGSGKSALAAKIAIGSGFPFVKVLSCDAMVGFSEQAKCSHIIQVFRDAHRSPLSCLVLDDLERLLEYVPIGPRFSNAVLQALLVLAKAAPPKGRKMLILATTSNLALMEGLGLSDVFTDRLNVPALNAAEIASVVRSLGVFEPLDVPEAVEAIASDSAIKVPIKRLLTWVDMARQQSGSRVSLPKWRQTLNDST
jgi:vesicle-fusing ATPase